MKSVWISLCSAGIGGAERRALKLTIFLARETNYSVNLIVNRNLLSFFKNDVQVNEAIDNKEFNIFIAEDFTSKKINYKHFFGILKKLDGKHNFLIRIPYLYKVLLRYFSYDSLFSKLPIQQNDIVHCFGTDAVRLGLLLNNTLVNNKVVIELVGNKFLSRFSNHLKVIGVENENIVFKAVSQTVLENFNSYLERDQIKLNNEVSEWDGPFIYFFNTDVSHIKKENVIVFASRFNPPKNPILFSEVIKELFDNNALDNWKVIIRGRGALETQIKEILREYIKNKKVDVGFSGELYKDFAVSKVVVSLIETGNYPSQSLFEAMSYGVIPIISNTGNSFEKYNNDGVIFCDLDKIDLKEKLSELTIKIEKEGGFYNETSNKIEVVSKGLTVSSNYINQLNELYE